MVTRLLRWSREMVFWIVGGTFLLVVLLAGFLSVWGDHPKTVKERESATSTTSVVPPSTSDLGTAPGTTALTTTTTVLPVSGPAGPRGPSGETKVVIVTVPTTQPASTTTTSTTTTTAPAPPLVCILGKCS